MADLIERDAALRIVNSEYAVTANDKVEQVLRNISKSIGDIPAVNRWIPVEDALPDAFIYVICAGEEGMAIFRLETF